MELDKQALTEIINELCEKIMELTGLDGLGNEVVPCTMEGFELLAALFISSIDRLTIMMVRERLPMSDVELNDISEELVDDLELLMERYKDHAEILHRFIRKSAGGLN